MERRKKFVKLLRVLPYYVTISYNYVKISPNVSVRFREIYEGDIIDNILDKQRYSQKFLFGALNSWSIIVAMSLSFRFHMLTQLSSQTLFSFLTQIKLLSQIHFIVCLFRNQYT